MAGTRKGPVGSRSRAIEVTRTGQWKQARSIFRGFAAKMNKGMERAGFDLAKQSAERIKFNILAQRYDHVPLAAGTLKNKKTFKILAETYGMLEAIEGFHLGGGRYAVGIRNDGPEAMKLGVHEFGRRPGVNDEGRPYPGIPARPTLRVELEELHSRRGLKPFADEARRILRGGIPTFGP